MLGLHSPLDLLRGGRHVGVRGVPLLQAGHARHDGLRDLHQDVSVAQCWHRQEQPWLPAGRRSTLRPRPCRRVILHAKCRTRTWLVAEDALAAAGGRLPGFSGAAGSDAAAPDSERSGSSYAGASLGSKDGCGSGAGGCSAVLCAQQRLKAAVSMAAAAAVPGSVTHTLPARQWRRPRQANQRRREASSRAPGS